MNKKRIKQIILSVILACSLVFSGMTGKATSISIKSFKLANSDITYVQRKQSVLIYHTHAATEKYIGTDVVEAGDKLAQILRQQGFYVEHITNQFDKEVYNKAYSNSRVMVQNKTLERQWDLVLDIHRDFGEKAFTTTVNGVEYAKTMVVLTNQNAFFSTCKQVADYIDSQLDKVSEHITRDQLTKWKVAQKYFNQDLNPHSLLLEIGSDKCSAESVHNTIKLLGSAITNYLHNIK